MRRRAAAQKEPDALLTKLTDGNELVVSEIGLLDWTTVDVILMTDKLTRRDVVLKVTGMPLFDITSDDGWLIDNIVASLAAPYPTLAGQRDRNGEEGESTP